MNDYYVKNLIDLDDVRLPYKLFSPCFLFYYSDIDDKHARRDRYTSGPVTEFKEKEHYRPEVKLDYVDETGHQMNQKEAFRYLSHRFHGKGSGKKKTEKRSKKQLEEEVK